MKKLITGILFILMLFSITACNAGVSDARQCLESYTKALISNDYESAYDMLSAFDKGNIISEQFVQWQTMVSKMVKVESFEIDKKTDKFNNYEYMGAKFKKAYGFRVLRVQKELLPEMKTHGYDSEDYRIMVVEEDGACKVALLVTQLEETLQNYSRQLEEKAE